MHLSEFKAWFEGFTDSIDGIPSPKQWNKIKERVSQITNDYTPAPIFVDRYVRPSWPYYGPYWNSPIYMAYLNNAVGTGQASQHLLSASNAAQADYKVTRDDWTNLGRADFESMQ